MKRYRSFWLCLLLLSISFVGCSPAVAFPRVASYYVSPFELTPDENKPYTALALSPDGETMAVGYDVSPSLVDLETGWRVEIYEEFSFNELDYNDLLDSWIDWSPDGRYLGIRADHYEPTSKGPVAWVLYVFDLQTKTVARYYGVGFDKFSPFNPDRISGAELLDLSDGTTSPFPIDFDFKQEQEFGGAGYELWSKRLDAPIAQLQTEDYGSRVGVVIESYNPSNPNNPKYSVPTGFISEYPNQLMGEGIIFDPTGEYVLVTEWQCSADSPTPCTISSSFNADNVYDTVLTLVRWRTGERRELTRLSKIDPENVVAYGYMAWSADGSTIFISRLNALPVVIKLK